ncbi:MAG TPA: sigma-70 family RNA polymerase sigma factor [Spirochaetia bacterium]|nr:sigma-70 family RNA polymerase sigma factor [Spirochaetia bacterium]
MNGSVSDVPEQEIIRRVTAGDTEAFRYIVERYQGPVFAMGLRFLRNREAAEDYAQEVFLRAFRSLHTYRGDARFYSWLMRVAYHMAIDASNGRKRDQSLGDLEPVDRARTPEEQFLFRQTAASVREAMRKLPPHHAVCLDFYFFFDLRYEEISAMTGFPLNTIKSHIRRAKSHLRKSLGDSTDGGTP